MGVAGLLTADLEAYRTGHYLQTHGSVLCAGLPLTATEDSVRTGRAVRLTLPASYRREPPMRRSTVGFVLLVGLAVVLIVLLGLTGRIAGDPRGCMLVSV